MPSPINKKLLKHLANLSRMNLGERETEKLLADLREILSHFEELQKIDTSNVEPVAGGTHLLNQFREDGSRMNSLQGKGKEDFPAEENGFNKVPPIF